MTKYFDEVCQDLAKVLPKHISLEKAKEASFVGYTGSTNIRYIKDLVYYILKLKSGIITQSVIDELINAFATPKEPVVTGVILARLLRDSIAEFDYNLLTEDNLLKIIKAAGKSKNVAGNIMAVADLKDWAPEKHHKKLLELHENPNVCLNMFRKLIVNELKCQSHNDKERDNIFDILLSSFENTAVQEGSVYLVERLFDQLGYLMQSNPELITAENIEKLVAQPGNFDFIKNTLITPKNYREIKMNLFGRNVTVAGLANPKNNENELGVFDFLQNRGFSKIISLHEEPTDPYLVKYYTGEDNSGREIIDKRMSDWSAPNTDDFLELLRYIRNSNDNSIALFCGEGFGRTGTFHAGLALYELMERKYNENKDCFNDFNPEKIMSFIPYKENDSRVLMTSNVYEAIRKVRMDDGSSPKFRNAAETPGQYYSLMQLEKELARRFSAKNRREKLGDKSVELDILAEDLGKPLNAKLSKVMSEQELDELFDHFRNDRFAAIENTRTANKDEFRIMIDALAKKAKLAGDFNVLDKLEKQGANLNNITDVNPEELNQVIEVLSQNNSDSFSLEYADSYLKKVKNYCTYEVYNYMVANIMRQLSTSDTYKFKDELIGMLFEHEHLHNNNPNPSLSHKISDHNRYRYVWNQVRNFFLDDNSNNNASFLKFKASVEVYFPNPHENELCQIIDDVAFHHLITGSTYNSISIPGRMLAADAVSDECKKNIKNILPNTDNFINLLRDEARFTNPSTSAMEVDESKINDLLCAYKIILTSETYTHFINKVLSRIETTEIVNCKLEIIRALIKAGANPNKLIYQGFDHHGIIPDSNEILQAGNKGYIDSVVDRTPTVLPGYSYPGEDMLNPAIILIDKQGMNEEPEIEGLFLPDNKLIFALRADGILAIGAKPKYSMAEKIQELMPSYEHMPGDYYGGHPTLTKSFNDPNKSVSPVYAGWLTLREVDGNRFIEAPLESGRFNNQHLTPEQRKVVELKIASQLMSALGENLPVRFNNGDYRNTREYFHKDIPYPEELYNEITFEDICKADPKEASNIISNIIKMGQQYVAREMQKILNETNQSQKEKDSVKNEQSINTSGKTSPHSK